MLKDVDGWNGKKKKVHNRADTPFFHTREIWWCALGVNVGFEQDGAGGELLRTRKAVKAML